MDQQNRISPNDHEPGTVPAQPEATPAIKTSKPMMYIIGGIILVIVLLNLGNLIHRGTKEAPKSTLPIRPASPNAQQVTSFEAQQRLLAQRDEAERIRQQQLAAQMALLQQEQAVPGPESASAAPMTEAQRRAIYGDSPNAPKNTSNISQAQAEAKQKALAMEKQHQDALNSDTVAIDFARSGASNPPVVSETAANGPVEGPTPEPVGHAVKQANSLKPLSAMSQHSSQQRRTLWLHTISTAIRDGYIASSKGPCLKVSSPTM